MLESSWINTLHFGLFFWKNFSHFLFSICNSLFLFLFFLSHFNLVNMIRYNFIFVFNHFSKRTKSFIIIFIFRLILDYLLLFIFGRNRCNYRLNWSWTKFDSNQQLFNIVHAIHWICYLKSFPRCLHQFLFFYFLF